jgi:phosphoenolpyruvate-protein kinase (PTS system EI component)
LELGSICRELAGKTHMVGKLFKIGLKEFPVAPTKVLGIKKAVYEKGAKVC